MNESITRWLRRVGLGLGFGAGAVLLPAASGWSQDLPAPPAVEERQEAREEAREIRRETRDAAQDAPETRREAVRETREEARDAAETRREAADVRTRPGEAVQESVEAVREGTRDAAENARDTRDAAVGVRQRANANARVGQQSLQDFQVSDYRPADFGLWFDRAAQQGLVISDLATTGTIADLGFTAGDRIVSVNGQPVVSEAEFMNSLFAPQFRDQRVQVLVDRDGVRETVVVEPSVLIREVGMVEEDPLEELGIVLDDRYHDRALIWKVIRRSPAFYAGIRPGDTITAINRQRVMSPEDAHQAAANVDAGPVVIQVSRGDRFRDVEVELAPSDVAPPALRQPVQELPPPTAPAPPQAVAPPAPPATPPATVVTPAPQPRVVVPADPTPKVTPRASRPVRPGLFPRLRQR